MSMVTAIKDRLDACGEEGVVCRDPLENLCQVPLGVLTAIGGSVTTEVKHKPHLG